LGVIKSCRLNSAPPRSGRQREKISKRITQGKKGKKKKKEKRKEKK